MKMLALEYQIFYLSTSFAKMLGMVYYLIQK